MIMLLCVCYKTLNKFFIKYKMEPIAWVAEKASWL